MLLSLPTGLDYAEHVLQAMQHFCECRLVIMDLAPPGTRFCSRPLSGYRLRQLWDPGVTHISALSWPLSA
jgi:hypothetical protein